ncbi:keratin-associated protein 4-1-like [Limulus polyphemus]|uniref:Keratin-associated protein 4-1-like n=1 Tax=Limulus polyphemus TaxID=6850 RepID=A0ABM1TFP8_LIMPO|nr:keratin-associated protein 4-1-like [Limulus polyphemus]
MNASESSSEVPTELVRPSLFVPPAGILILAIVGYLFLVMIALLVRQRLLARGFCGEGCKDESCDCCYWCRTCAETCDCSVPSVDQCLDVLCPKKEKLNCSCPSCPTANPRCCLPPSCDCGNCNITCEPQCDSFNCLCCTVSFK